MEAMSKTLHSLGVAAETTVTLVMGTAFDKVNEWCPAVQAKDLLGAYAAVLRNPNSPAETIRTPVCEVAAALACLDWRRFAQLASK